jgi:hypothetical protein
MKRVTKRKINLRRKTRRNKRKNIRRGGVRPSNIPSYLHTLTNEQKDFFYGIGLHRDQIVRLERTLASKYNIYPSRRPFDQAVQEIADDILENGPDIFDESLTRYVRSHSYSR